MRRLARICGHSLLVDPLHPGAVVVDLGMHEGEFAGEIRARTGCRVWGAEPLPELCEALQGRAGIVAQPVAIAGAAGAVSLGHKPGTCATVVDTMRLPGTSSVEVEALDLAGFLDRHDLDDVDLLKVDIEGAELGVLAGISEARLHRITQITVEFHDWMDPSQTPQVRAVSRRLRDCGFRQLTFTRDASDVLFVNEHRLRLGAPMRAALLLRHKYVRGVFAISRRAIDRVRKLPAGSG